MKLTRIILVILAAVAIYLFATWHPAKLPAGWPVPGIHPPPGSQRAQVILPALTESVDGGYTYVTTYTSGRVGYGVGFRSGQHWDSLVEYVDGQMAAEGLAFHTELDGGGVIFRHYRTADLGLLAILANDTNEHNYFLSITTQPKDRQQ